MRKLIFMQQKNDFFFIFELSRMFHSISRKRSNGTDSFPDVMCSLKRHLIILFRQHCKEIADARLRNENHSVISPESSEIYLH